MTRTQPLPRERPAASSIDALAVWAVALALGVLYHEWQVGAEWVSVESAAAIAAIFVLLRPTSVRRLLVVFVLLAAELVVALPEPLNHTLLLGVVALGVLLDWLWIRAQGSDLAFHADFFLVRAAPTLRVSFIVMWFAAALAKVNSDFLSPDVSCALWIVDSITFVSVDALPVVARQAIVAGTVLTEFAIPVLLIFRRTRVAGVALGWVFHLVAALAGHTAFSGLGWSMYLLFLPSGTLAAVAAVAAARWRDVPEHIRAPLTRSYRHPATGPTLVLLWVTALLALHQLPEVWFNRARRFGPMLPYVALAPAWAWLVWTALRRRGAAAHDAADAAALRLRQPVAWVVVGVLVVNALSPYLGLKTRSSFTMYSNLRTEADLWNHHLVPEEVRVADLEDRVVRIVSVDRLPVTDELEAVVGRLVPVGEARRVLSSAPAGAVVYEIDGDRRVADPISADTVVGEPIPAGLTSLLSFRPVEPRTVCQH